MKINYDDLKTTIYLPCLNKKYFANKTEIEEYIKDLIVSLKKRDYKISGILKTKAFFNKKYGLIIEINKEEEIDFFPDLIDLKIMIYNDSPIYLKFEDYFLINDLKEIYKFNNNYYLSIDSIEEKHLLKLSDFYNIIYGEEAINLKSKLIKI